MKKILLSSFFIGLAGISFAQSSFQKAISISPYVTLTPMSVAQSADGGYLIGAVPDGSGASMIKLDAAGNSLWSKDVSGAGMSLLSFQESTTGGYFAFGTTLDQTLGTNNFYLSVFDASMNIQWTKTYPIYDPGYGYTKIRQLADGSFMISESFYSKMGALKLDATGNVSWHCSFTDGPKCPSFDCYPAPDGSFLFTGKRNNDICMVKVDANGQQLWSKTYNSGIAYYHTKSVTPTADGGFLMAGYQDMQPFLMKTDAQGTITWFHTYMNSCLYGSEIDQVIELSSGELLLCGKEAYYSIPFVVKADANGNPISSIVLDDVISLTFNYSWSQPYFTQTSDGGVALVTSYTNSTTLQGTLAFFKLDGTLNAGCTTHSFPFTIDPNSVAPSEIANVNLTRISENITSSGMGYNPISMAVASNDFCLLFGTNEAPTVAAEINVYPSPVVAGNTMTLNFRGFEGEGTMQIFDLNGRVIISQTLVLQKDGTNAIVETNSLAAGMYCVQLNDATGEKIATQRLIVR
jgi:Secretion system C-terminal sorting domain